MVLALFLFISKFPSVEEKLRSDNLNLKTNVNESYFQNYNSYFFASDTAFPLEIIYEINHELSVFRLITFTSTSIAE